MVSTFKAIIGDDDMVKIPCFTPMWSLWMRSWLQTTLTLWDGVHFALKNIAPAKSNIDTKNDCLENVSSFKHGYFGYPC